MKTEWTNERLSRLFDRYNRLYWRGRLKEWKTVNDKLDDCLGFCDGRRRRLTVDCSKHSSDKAIRSTLLHEMCHAAVPGRGIAHGSAFWRQLEMLLRKKAPIEVGDPEAPAGFWTLEPPAKFRLARRQFLKAHEREVRRQVRELERKGVHIGEDEHITMEDIAERFKYVAEYHGTKWKDALFAILGENGLLDVDFKPTSAARRNLPLFHKHHRRGLRKRREHEAAKKMWRERGVDLDGAGSAPRSEKPPAPK